MVRPSSHIAIVLSSEYKASKDEKESYGDMIGKDCLPIKILIISDVHING
jgi:hypothetical protein